MTIESIHDSIDSPLKESAYILKSCFIKIIEKLTKIEFSLSAISKLLLSKSLNKSHYHIQHFKNIKKHKIFNYKVNKMCKNTLYTSTLFSQKLPIFSVSSHTIIYNLIHGRK